MVQNLAILKKIFHFKLIESDIVKTGQLTEFEAKSWMEEMENANKYNKFLYATTMFTVLGKKCE